MVCLPCIFLPLALAIYLKFIQPFVYRLLPQSWVDFLDKYLFPTCPIQQPPAAKTDENKENITCCSSPTEEDKKDN